MDRTKCSLHVRKSARHVKQFGAKTGKDKYRKKKYRAFDKGTKRNKTVVSLQFSSLFLSFFCLNTNCD